MNFLDERVERWQIEVYSSEHGGRARWLPIGGLYHSKVEADRDAAAEHSKRRGETLRQSLEVLGLRSPREPLK